MPEAVDVLSATRSTLEAALRAPSAHNAQPWRVSQIEGDRYELWYAFADKLLADPDDRDGLIAVGGFFETMRLAGEARGLETEFEPAVVRHALGITLGTVRFVPLLRAPDPLADAIERRQCNRYPYDKAPLPVDLRADLEATGNVILPAADVVHLVSEAASCRGGIAGSSRIWRRGPDSSRSPRTA